MTTTHTALASAARLAAVLYNVELFGLVLLVVGALIAFVSVTPHARKRGDGLALLATIFVLVAKGVGHHGLGT